VDRIATDDEISKAIYDPPKDTRAYFRGMCLQRYADEIVSASWDSVIFDLKEGPLKKIFMLEPLRGTEAHVRQLLTESPTAADLFQTELEHYEKVEGENLSLEGKANRLSQMIRMNLPAAMQGLAVVPIFAGFDEKAGIGRLFKYDITGGRYEETNFDAQGSGSKDARDSLKKLWKRDMSRDEALHAALEALIDAADEDVGTGGPDLVRGIFPSVKTITRSGFGEVPDDEVKRLCEAILAERSRTGNGA